MCVVEIDTEGPPHAFRNMYLGYILFPAPFSNERDLPLQMQAH